MPKATHIIKSISTFTKTVHTEEIFKEAYTNYENMIYKMQFIPVIMVSIFSNQLKNE